MRVAGGGRSVGDDERSVGDDIGDGIQAVDNGVGGCASRDDEVRWRKSTVSEMQRALVLESMTQWQL